MNESTEVTWDLDGMTMYGTFLRPDGEGPFPAAVFVAGSGPTDRDWCSPLLPGTNGSGRLLAEVLAEAGIASLRYDKRASGPHAMENVGRLVGQISMGSHLDELVAAVTALAARDDVDVSRVVGLGNSEGTLHVLHYATTPQAIPFVGVVLVAPPGRSVGTLLLSQLGAQAALLPDGENLMDKVRAATARYEAGEPMDPDPSLPDSVKMILASFETPANLPFARELWSEDATDGLAQLRVPALVLIGGRDIQVDATADGAPLEAAATGAADVTFAYPPNANHVVKEELRPAAEVAAAPGSGYNEDGTRLDPDAVDVMLGWLQRVLAPATGDGPEA